MAERRKPKGDLSIPALEVLEFAVDNKVWLVTSSLGSGEKAHFDRRNEAMKVQLPPVEIQDGQDTGPRWAPREDVPEVTHHVFDALFRRRFVYAMDKERLCEKYGLDSGINGYFAWYAKPWGISKEGREYLEANRERLEAARKERAEAPEELIVVEAGDSWNRSDDGVRRVGALCRVVRRTEKRIYVEVVEKSKGLHYDGNICGRRGNLYVDAGKVMAEGVTPDSYRRMLQADRDYEEAIGRARSQMEDELAPIRKRYADRASQLQAQLEDELREALHPERNAPRP